MRQLIAGWEEVDPDGRGVTVAHMLTELADNPADHEAIRSALWELCPPREGKAFNPRSVGMKLHHLWRRVIGGKYIDQKPGPGHTVLWFVGNPERENCRGSRGTEGTTISPSRACAHTHAHAREKSKTSLNSPPSPTSPQGENGLCEHTNVAETPTFDGYINRQCRDCGAELRCRKPEQTV